MEDLLKNKLKAAVELKTFTKNIRDLSLKTEHDKVNWMFEERQNLIENINIINRKITSSKNAINFIESEEMKILNKKTREVFTEIFEIDNLIRKNINDELKSVKEKLIHPISSSKLVNIKA